MEKTTRITLEIKAVTYIKQRVNWTKRYYFLLSQMVSMFQIIFLTSCIDTFNGELMPYSISIHSIRNGKITEYHRFKLIGVGLIVLILYLFVRVIQSCLWIDRSVSLAT